MSENRPVRRLRLLYPGLFLLLLLLLAAILPAVPQPGLQNLLESRLHQKVPGDLRTGAARLQIFPRPGIVVDGCVLASPSLKLDLERLELDFSLLSLLSLKPVVSSLRLAGGTVVSSAFTGGDLARLLDRGLARLVPGNNLSRISFSGLTVRLPAPPGIVTPLEFANLSGEFRQLGGVDNASLKLTGKYGGGEVELKTVWYRDDTAGAGEKAASDEAAISAGTGRGVEVKARLAGGELHFSNDFRSADQGFAELTCRRSDLYLDINGNVADGLRFTLSLKAPDHRLAAYNENGELAREISRGSLELKGSGYFQPQAGYLNLKSSALVLPGAGVVYARGLVRFREPFFVDLVTHLRVDDLEQAGRRCAGVLPPGLKARGQLQGDLNLIGNLFDVPVLKVFLRADKIQVENRPENVADGKWQASALLLDRLAKWEWMADCDCRIASLRWNDFRFRNFVLVAKKKTTQFEIERLAAEFEPRGRARLTLIVDDLLDTPRWQASLVTRQVDLGGGFFGPGLPACRLDLSLVGGGPCGAGVDYRKAAEFDGSWSLSHGRFAKQPLWIAFNRFLADSGRRPWPGDFSGRGKIVCRQGSLGLNGLTLKFPGGRQISGRGGCGLAPVRLDFSGLVKEKGYRARFTLEGSLQAPRFSKSAP